MIRATPVFFWLHVVETVLWGVSTAKADAGNELATQLLQAVNDPLVSSFVIPAGQQANFANVDVSVPAVLAGNRTFTVSSNTNWIPRVGPGEPGTLFFANKAHVIEVAPGSRLIFSNLAIGGIPSRRVPLPVDSIPYDPTGLLIFPSVTTGPGGATEFRDMSLQFPYSRCGPEQLVQVVAGFNRAFNTTALELEQDLLVLRDDLRLQLTVLDRQNMSRVAGTHQLAASNVVLICVLDPVLARDNALAPTYQGAPNDQRINETQAPSAAPSQDSHIQAFVLVLAIILPIAVLAVTAAAVTCIVLPYRRRKRSQRLAAAMSVKSASSAAGVGSSRIGVSAGEEGAGGTQQGGSLGNFTPGMVSSVVATSVGHDSPVIALSQVHEQQGDVYVELMECNSTSALSDVQVAGSVSKDQILRKRVMEQRCRAPERGSLVVRREVGRGSYGKVYEGRWNGLPVAIKVVKHNSISGSRLLGEARRMRTADHQAALMVVHPNVVATYCMFDSMAEVPKGPPGAEGVPRGGLGAQFSSVIGEVIYSSPASSCMGPQEQASSQPSTQASVLASAQSSGVLPAGQELLPAVQHAAAFGASAAATRGGASGHSSAAGPPSLQAPARAQSTFPNTPSSGPLPGITTRGVANEGDAQGAPQLPDAAATDAHTHVMTADLVTPSHVGHQSRLTVEEPPRSPATDAGSPQHGAVGAPCWATADLCRPGTGMEPAPSRAPAEGLWRGPSASPFQATATSGFATVALQGFSHDPSSDSRLTGHVARLPAEDYAAGGSDPLLSTGHDMAPCARSPGPRNQAALTDDSGACPGPSTVIPYRSSNAGQPAAAAVSATGSGSAATAQGGKAVLLGTEPSGALDVEPWIRSLGPQMQTNVIMEWCDGGTLLNCIHQQLLRDGQGLKLDYVVMCLRDIAAGMEALNQHTIVHGDLKPANVLLKRQAADERGFVCKVADMGLARLLGVSDSGLQVTHQLTQTLGTVHYQAPEVLMEGRLTNKTDVWSFGAVAYELLSGKCPFAGLSSAQVLYKLTVAKERQVVPADFPPALAKLVRDCWSEDQNQRPTFGELLQRLQLLASPGQSFGSQRSNHCAVGSKEM